MDLVSPGRLAPTGAMDGNRALLSGIARNTVGGVATRSLVLFSAGVTGALFEKVRLPLADRDVIFHQFADMDKDGKVDLVVIYAAGVGGNFHVYKGTGDLKFDMQSPVVSSVPNVSRFMPGYTALQVPITLTDLNRDGLPDLYFYYYAPLPTGELLPTTAPSHNIYVNNGQGGMNFVFNSPDAVVGANSISDYLIADFDLDGVVDQVHVLHTPLLPSYSLVFRKGLGTGAFSATPVLTPLPSRGFALATIQLERGAAPALAVLTDFDTPVRNLEPGRGPGSTVLHVFSPQAGGAFARKSSTPIGAGTEILRVADFDQDGAPEIAVASADLEMGPGVHILNVKPDGSVYRRAFIETDSRIGYFNNFHVADCNGDGIPDLISLSSPGTSVVLSSAKYQLGGKYFVSEHPVTKQPGRLIRIRDDDGVVSSWTLLPGLGTGTTDIRLGTYVADGANRWTFRSGIARAAVSGAPLDALGAITVFKSLATNLPPLGRTGEGSLFAALDAAGLPNVVDPRAGTISVHYPNASRTVPADQAAAWDLWYNSVLREISYAEAKLYVQDATRTKISKP